MPRSYDQRRFPGGPRYGPGDKQAMRGPDRLGPIGTIVPGDDVEVARELQRIWLHLRRPTRAGGGGGCCPDLSGGPGAILYGTGFEALINELGGLSLWYRLTETPSAGNSGVYDVDGVVQNQGADWNTASADVHLDQRGGAAGTVAATQPVVSASPPPYGPPDRQGWDFEYDQDVYTTGNRPGHYLAGDDFLASLGGEAIRADMPLSTAAKVTAAAGMTGGVLNEFTSFGWLKPEDNATALDYHEICWGVWGMQSGGINQDDGWAVRVHHNTKLLTVVIRVAGVETVLTGPQLADAWYFVAFTWDGTNARLYLNGVLVDTEALATFGVSPQPTFRIANGDYDFGVSDADAFYHGELAEIGVVQKAWSGDSIGALFSAFGSTTEGTASGELPGSFIADGTIPLDKLAPGVDNQVVVSQGGSAQWASVPTPQALTDHLADTSDAHDASAISYVGGTGMSATDVEAAVDELANEKLDSARISCRAYKDSDLTIPTATDTAVTFNQERWDTAAIHSVAANTDRFVAPSDGLYEVIFQFRFAANATGVRIAWIEDQAGTRHVQKILANVGATWPVDDALVTQIDLNAGDWVRAMVYQDSGGNLALTSASPRSPEFIITKKGTV